MQSPSFAIEGEEGSDTCRTESFELWMNFHPFSELRRDFTSWADNHFFDGMTFLLKGLNLLNEKGYGICGDSYCWGR